MAASPALEIGTDHLFQLSAISRQPSAMKPIADRWWLIANSETGERPF
jgi:hypothetical protein